MNKIDWHHSIIRIAIAITALVGVFCLFHYVLEPYMVEVDTYIEKLGVWGPILFIAIFAIGTTLLFPEAILALAAGAVFGVWWGALWITIGGIIASFVMFLSEDISLEHPFKNSFLNIQNFKHSTRRFLHFELLLCFVCRHLTILLSVT